MASLADIDRRGVRVVVNPGGTNAQFDEANLKNASIIRYPDNNTIFGQLVDGQSRRDDHRRQRNTLADIA